MSLHNLSSLVRAIFTRSNRKLICDGSVSTRVLLTRRKLCGISNGHQNSHSLTGLMCPITGVQGNLTFKRFKKTTKRKSAAYKDEDDGEEEEDDEDEADENPLLTDDILEGNQADGSEDVVLDVISLRLDAVGKSALSITRARMEEAFYKGEIYINGEKAAKKSQDLYEGDEVDLVLQIDPENRSILHVKRFVLEKLPDKTSEHGRLKIKIKRWRSLQIEAYENRNDG